MTVERASSDTVPSGPTKDQQLVLVLGVGRSGTSLITGILGQVGFHVPQPEIQADDTNPRGFGEPEWVVKFHTRLMEQLRLTVFDARPRAWEIAGGVTGDPAIRAELRDWLETQLGAAGAVIIKDPRIGWFLPLWTGCSVELGVPPSCLVTLRHPAEILASARSWYGRWQTDASRAAAWLNVMLETERATRSKPRVFVRYEDLLGDWLGEVRRIGDQLDLPLLRRLDQARLAEVGEFVDPTLHRSRVGWDELDVPPAIREMAEEVWEQLQLLARPDPDTTGAAPVLDATRSRFDELYAEAESIAQSSVTAVKPRRPRPKPPPPRTLRARVTRRIPKRIRVRLRSLAASLRRST
jgi:hypothetical protein